MLSFGKIEITDNNLQIIIDKIESLNIKKLRIYYSNIDNAINNIVKIIKLSNLQELVVKCDSNHWQQIIEALNGNTTLTHLDLSESNFGENKDVLVLTNTLKNNTNVLTHIDLSKTNFYKDTMNVLAIAEALKYNTSLTYLNISAKIQLATPFTNGAEYIELAKALKDQNTLKTLQIDHLKLNNNVYNAFIEHATLLQNLHFNYNNITLPSTFIVVTRPNISESNYINVYALR